MVMQCAESQVFVATRCCTSCASTSPARKDVTPPLTTGCSMPSSLCFPLFVDPLGQPDLQTARLCSALQGWQLCNHDLQVDGHLLHGLITPAGLQHNSHKVSTAARMVWATLTSYVQQPQRWGMACLGQLLAMLLSSKQESQR